MAERWVINASPIILLAKINYQHLLTTLPDEVLVPEAVVVEINAGSPNDPAREFLRTTSLKIVQIPPDPIVLAWDLGNGETSVLSYALRNSGWTAVLDDGMARRCAHTLAVPLIGTLGIILRARQAVAIPAAVPLLQALQAHGFRLNERVIRTALAAVGGEDWEGRS